MTILKRMPKDFYVNHKFNDNEKDFIYFMKNYGYRLVISKKTPEKKKKGFTLSTIKSYFNHIYKINKNNLENGLEVKLTAKNEKSNNRDYSATVQYNNFLKHRKENPKLYTNETRDNVYKIVKKIIDMEIKNREKNKEKKNKEKKNNIKFSNEIEEVFENPYKKEDKKEKKQQKKEKKKMSENMKKFIKEIDKKTIKKLMYIKDHYHLKIDKKEPTKDDLIKVIVKYFKDKYEE